MLPNSFIKKFSWVLLFSMLFSLVSILPEEPAYASTFACTDSDGRAYLFQATQTSNTSDTLKIYRSNVTGSSGDGNTGTLVASFDFSGATGSTDQINGFTMDEDGNAYIFYKNSSNNRWLYKLNMPGSLGAEGTISNLGQMSTTGDVNSATYIQVDSGANAGNYIVFSKGFGKGGRGYVKLNSATSIDSTIDGDAWSLSGSISNKGDAKDMEWLVNPITISSVDYNLAAIALKGDTMILGKFDGSSTIAAINVDLNKPSGWTTAHTVGAMYGLGGSAIWGTNNSTEEIGKFVYNSSSGEFDGTDLGDFDYVGNNNNQDGAGCHAGDPIGTASVTTELLACSNGAAVSRATLSTTGSAYFFDLDYSIDGGSNWTNLQNGQEVSAGGSETYSAPAQAHGVTVSWRYRYDVTNPSSGDYITATSRTVDCDPNSTISQSLAGSCSSGAKTSTLSITNNESVTAYYKVEYQIDSGSFVELKGASDDLSVSAGATDTSITQAVPDGSTITWRITDSFTDGNYTNMSVENVSESSTVDCDPSSTVSQAIT